MSDQPPSSRAAIRQIACDNTAGAAEILLRAAEVYSLLTGEQGKRESPSAEDAIRRVVEVSVGLLEAQPNMAPLARLASAAAEAAREAASADEALNRAETAARSFAANAALAGETAATHAADLIHDQARVLTHSRSSTVLLAFKLALKAGKRVEVFATESRPMMEGRTLAIELSREGASVILIADAAAAICIKQLDFVLLGADKVTTSNVVNKVGTRSIALVARDLGKPVHAVCDSSKFINLDEGFLTSPSCQDNASLWPNAPAGIQVLNPYFETTPLDFFTSIVTEEGAMRPEEAARLAERFVLHDWLLEARDGLRRGMTL